MRYRSMLGERRADWLADRTAAHAEQNAARPEAELRAEREQADVALGRLDRAGATSYAASNRRARTPTSASATR